MSRARVQASLALRIRCQKDGKGAEWGKAKETIAPGACGLGRIQMGKAWTHLWDVLRQWQDQRHSQTVAWG